MTEPFAIYRAGIGDVRTFDGRIVRGSGAPDSLSMLRDDLNDAALKYAADKIREAADFEDGLALIIEKNIVANEAHYRKYPGGKPGQLQSAREKREVAQRLRNHADAVERGEA